MFIGTIWTFTYKKCIRNINRPIAVHMVIDIIRVEDGLVKYRKTFPGGPAAFFADYTQKTYVVKTTVILMQTLLADGVVVYRCHVVWQSICVVILPCMMWCAIAACGSYMVYDLSLVSDAESVFTNQTGRWVRYSLSLLSRQIWSVQDCWHIASGRSNAVSLQSALGGVQGRSCECLWMLPFYTLQPLSPQ
ncbi:uncharacterized protein EDB93DRAFT_1152400 [Suillus bovinus]|uniref:uncharacterized protein n=1 Tax=Suillus bovinus TaxID=48563 RepID=UPI001B87EC28|nr:uncharacterized protein EDB93DRAFT_1152400 [Suillus bovinus]KAG2144640.1 hypothetical protein EDB93DRAFT_1152400 [Suillus bovinus]